MYKTAASNLRRRNGIKQRKMRCGEITIAYDEAGSRDLPTLVCLPGFASTKDHFINLTAELCSDFHVVVPDLPGFGCSSKPQGAIYSLQQYGRWFQKFFERLRVTGSGPTHFLGNSLGGAIGLEMALNRGYEFRSMALIAPGGIMPGASHEPSNGGNPFSTSDMRSYDAFANRLTSQSKSISPAIKAYVAGQFTENKEWFERIMGDLPRTTEPRKADCSFMESAFNNRLHEIQCPTMVAWGQDDDLLPPQLGRFAAEQIPDSHFELLSGNGHCPHIEAPRRLAKSYRTFHSTIYRNLTHSIDIPYAA